jgi:hypothetical protein
VKILTYLHMMVKHSECWHICKGIKGGKKRDEVLPLMAPPPRVWCTATPVAVTTWQWPRRSWARAPSVAVCTALCTTVHHQGVSGVTALFFQRLGKTGMGTAAGIATPVQWHRPNNLETVVFGGLAGVAPPHPVRCHRHPYSVTNS